MVSPHLRWLSNDAVITSYTRLTQLWSRSEAVTNRCCEIHARKKEGVWNQIHVHRYQPAMAPKARTNQQPCVSLSSSRPGRIKKPGQINKTRQVKTSQDKPRQIESKAQYKTESCFVLGLLILDESFTWHRPIFSGGCPPNIVGATAFHSRVRDGSEWFHYAMDTRIERLAPAKAWS
jgi:hypothetical protein